MTCVPTQSKDRYAKILDQVADRDGLASVHFTNVIQYGPTSNESLDVWVAIHTGRPLPAPSPMDTHIVFFNPLRWHVVHGGRAFRVHGNLKIAYAEMVLLKLRDKARSEVDARDAEREVRDS